MLYIAIMVRGYQQCNVYAWTYCIHLQTVGIAPRIPPVSGRGYGDILRTLEEIRGHYTCMYVHTYTYKSGLYSLTRLNYIPPDDYFVIDISIFDISNNKKTSSFIALLNK